jgi:hypothetical protein
VIAPQRRRRAQQRHIGGRHLIDIKGNEVSGEPRHLAATTEGDGDDPGEYRGCRDEEQDWHANYRAMLRCMVSAPGGRRVIGATVPPAAGTALLAVAGTVAEATAAAAAGAAFIDLGPADQAVRAGQAVLARSAAIAALRASHPGLLICADSEQADLVRDQATALRSGAILICDGLALAKQAVASAGMPRGRLLVETEPDGVSRALAAGFAVLVDLRDGPAAAAAPGAAAAAAPGAADPGAADPGAADPGAAGSGAAGSGAPPGALAVAAICAWLGATMVRTSHPQQVRWALDMADSIRGGRPPARTVRGLA